MKRRTLLFAGIATPIAAAAGLVLRDSAAANAPALPAGTIVSRIRVEKGRRRMTLYRDGAAIKAYSIALGFGEPDAKTREGDGRTPEGAYRISGRNPQSRYHLSLRISYPAARDIAAAARRGEPPGSDIMIHGLPNGLGAVGRWHLKRDWTAGCIAVTNTEIEEIWRVVPDDTPIEILA